MTYPLLIPARKICLLLFISVFLFPLLTVTGQVPRPPANSFVNDQAKVLIPEDIDALNQRIRALQENHGVQIAVILVDKLPDTIEIEDFARNIGREWQVGTDRKGLVYVASISQHKQRLEVAANLEGDIPDVTAHEITDQSPAAQGAER